ncbi:MAG: SIS domain-containing protein [Clostridia bacterium]|nr:SIS domain-containing protein [Clostridia bacterium]
MLCEKKNSSLDRLITRYPRLGEVRGEIEDCFSVLLECFKVGGKLLCCGNGGSASDSEHIVGELMKSFKLKRPIDGKYAMRLREFGDEGAELAEKLEGTLTAIALVGHSALSTAFGNDKQADMCFAQQVNGYGAAGDVLLTLTTSGNSQNCVYAAMAAKARGMKVISVTGENGGRMLGLSDVCIRVPEKETYLVQELTLPVYHWLCAELESVFWGN